MMNKNWFKIFAVVLAILATSLIVVYIKLRSDSTVKRYAQDLMTALNNEHCTSLYPLSQINDITDSIACPRGDVGNFMVIDKVVYQLETILGTGPERQALVKVCIKARGNAAWNEGDYDKCSGDARILNLSLNNFRWVVKTSDFSDISNLINKSAAKPQGYDNYRDSCWETKIATGASYECNNAVRNDIEYSISTHKFVETGRAH